MSQRLHVLFFVTLFFATVVNMQSISPLVLEISRDLSVSVAQAGNLVSAMTGVGLVAALFMGPLSDRWGRKIVLLGGLLVQGVTAVACLFVKDYTTLLLLRMLSGVGQATNMTAGQAAVGDLYPPEKRAGALSTFVGFMGLGGVVGIPLVAVAADFLGWRMALALLGLMFLFAFTLGYFALPSRKTTESVAAAGYLRVFRSAREDRRFVHVLLAQFFCGTGSQLVTTYLGALYGQAYGLSPARSAWLFGLNGLSYFVSGMLVGRLVPRIGLSRIVLASVLASGLGSALLGSWHQGLLPLALLVGTMGVGRAGSYGPLSAMAQEVVPWARGTMVSLNALSTYVGMSAGSALGGFALTWGGWSSWGAAGAVCFAVSAAWMASLSRDRQSGELRPIYKH